MRIIECKLDEVNGPTSIHVKKNRYRVQRAFVVAMLCSCIALGACDRSEQKAEALMNDAMQHVASDELERAVELFDDVVQRYPTTSAARRARQERLLYDGLAVAVETYAQRAARDLMIRTAKALGRARSAQRAWPLSLDRLLPTLIAEPPIDPWGRPLAYERKSSGRGYRLACFGSDGRPGGEGDAEDFLVEDGDWVRAPAAG